MAVKNSQSSLLQHTQLIHKNSRFWISGVLDIFSWVGFKQTDWFTFSLGFPAIKIYGDNSVS